VREETVKELSELNFDNHGEGRDKINVKEEMKKKVSCERRKQMQRRKEWTVTCTVETIRRRNQV